MGELTFFLGLQVTPKDDGIFISHDKYVDEILKKFGFLTVKTASIPMKTSKPLLKDAEAEDIDVHLYRSMIGSLMYQTASRPDIMFVVCACARFQVTPKVLHLHDVKRIFRYLKGQPKLGLWYPKDLPFDLEAYTNSNYTGASLDRKSTTGGCQFLRRRLISWQCMKQTMVTNSTTKAEYVAASSCCRQVLWIQNQMIDYGYNFMNTKIFIDNESTICIVKNLCFTQRLSTLDVTSLLSDFKRPPTLSLHSNAFQINGSDHNVCPNLLPPQSAVCPVLDQILQYASLLKNPFLNSITKWRIWNSAANTKHVPYLKKPYLGVKDSIDIVDFLNGSHIRYALTKNPTIYVSLIKKFWQTATVRIVDNRDQEITATIDGKEFTITEASVRRHLQLADVDGISVLPTTEIFDQLSLMGYVLLMIKLIFFKKGNFSLSEIFAIPSFMS
ncbi:hypothetical protein Tco_0896868 [Tanacetum coccineum]